MQRKRYQYLGYCLMRFNEQLIMNQNQSQIQEWQDGTGYHVKTNILPRIESALDYLTETLIVKL